MSDIFDEIDEELKQDSVWQWWKKYSRIIVPVLVVLVLVVAGYVAWDRYQQGVQESRAEAFAAAIEAREGGDLSGAADNLSALAAEGGVYGFLAAVEQGETLAASGDLTGAVAAFETAASKRSEPVYRDLANLQAAMAEVGAEEYAAAISRLESLTAEGRPYRQSARELTGIAMISKGDTDEGVAYLNELREDEGLPGQMSQRIAQFLTAVGHAPE